MSDILVMARHEVWAVGKQLLDLARKFTRVGRAQDADDAWRAQPAGLGLADGVAERVEAAHQALGGAVLVDVVEVVGAEVNEVVEDLGDAEGKA